jgi:hypothetical protein
MMCLVIIHIQMAEKITKSYPISLEGFWHDSEKSFLKIWNLYMKNIIFACP